MNQTLRPMRRERLQSALNTLKRLVEGLSPEDYGQVDRPRLLLPMKDYSFILFQMVQHVREYRPRKFSRAGIDSGVADILIAFGLEHGQPATVALRLQKRLSLLMLYPAPHRSQHHSSKHLHSTLASLEPQAGSPLVLPISLLST
jgi:hypothetical protein